MKTKIIAIILVIFISNICFSQNYNQAISTYVSFIEKQNTSAKDYVLNLFKKYDIVVLCERHHGEMTQYDLIYDIISSPYFQKNVGNIFTEVGASNSRKNVQIFLETKFTNQEEKKQRQLDVYRNIAFNLWEKTNFYDFIGRLNTFNSTLNKSNKINLFVSDNRDPNQEEASSIESFKEYFSIYKERCRDSIIAQNIITTYDSIVKKSKRKKALVIMNSRHAFSKSLSDDGTINVGDYLKRHYGEKFANVLINNAAVTNQVKKSEIDKPKVFQNMAEVLVQDGKWDASFKITNKENIGFDFKNSPFGNDDFDLWPYTEQNNRYQDIFTGFIFYLPIEKHWDSFGIKGIIDGHEEEIYKKHSLRMQSLGKEPGSIEKVKVYSNVVVEDSYEELDKMILMRDQWLKK